MVRVIAKNAPKAFGPFCQATVANGVVYTSGVMPLDPKDGTLVPGGIIEQTRQVLENLKNILEAAGSSLHKVLQITIYLTNLEKFEEMNEVYSTFFNGQYPARVTVGVSALAKQAMIEMQAVALVND